jgi:hypothetical protein
MLLVVIPIRLRHANSREVILPVTRIQTDVVPLPEDIAFQAPFHKCVGKWQSSSEQDGQTFASRTFALAQCYCLAICII